MTFSGQRRSQGFTLLEIMVAIVIFALVIAAIYSSWLAVMRGSKSALDAAAAVQRSRVAMSTLQEALWATRSFAADIQYYSFVAENGDDATLSFVSRLSPSFPRSGRFGDFDVRRVTFSIEPGPDSTRQLVLRQNPVLMEMDIDEQEHPVILARDIREFKVEFRDGRDPDWLEEWTQTNQLPKMVRITMQFGQPNPQAPPQDKITRDIALPSITVPANWQRAGGNP